MLHHKIETDTFLAQHDSNEPGLHFIPKNPDGSLDHLNEVFVIDYRSETDTYLVMANATAYDIRLRGGTLVWSGCLCGDCEADLDDNNIDYERSAEQIPLLVQACALFDTHYREIRA